MMKVTVLSSGSKGNSTLIETKNTKILIDLGVNKSYIENKLKEIKVDPNDISAILITHTHVDHIQGLRTFLKSYNPFVYTTDMMLSLLKEYLGEFNYKLYEDDTTLIGDIKVNVIKTSHDAKESIGFIVSSDDRSMVYITDTGYINDKYFKKLYNHDLYIMESNHDVEMLMEGSYPSYLKKRIIGDKGHLSNVQAAEYLTYFVGPKTKWIVLAHLSDENNNYEKAYDTVKKVLDSNNKKADKILIAKQKEMLETIDL